jgi:CRP-like cAMP-binding protein
MISIELLHHYPLFAHLSDAELSDVAACLTKRHFAKGVYLFHPGNPASRNYLIESGLVRLFFTNIHGQEFIIGLVGPYDTVGLPIFHERQTHIGGAAAVLPTTVLVLSQEDELRLVKRSPQLMYNINKELEFDIRKLMVFASGFASLSLNGRLANMLLFVSKLNPSQGGQDEFELPLSQAEIATWTGASRGHVNRALGTLQKIGLIRMEGQKIIILDRPGLQQMSEDVIEKV